MSDVEACVYEHSVYLSAPRILIPQRRYSNDDIIARIRENFRGDSQSWKQVERRLKFIFELFGTRFRFLEDDNPEPLATYAARAVGECLEAQDLSPESIDAVLYGGVCREYFEPATAIQVAAGAGIRHPGLAMDISAACAGLLNSLAIFAGLSAVDPNIETGVVVAIEGTGRHSAGASGILYDIQTPDEIAKRAAGLTIGNAGGAVAVSTMPMPSCGRIIASLSESFVEHHALSTVRVDGTFECDSFGLFRESHLFPPHLERLCASVNWELRDVAFFCVHQPSDRLIEKLADEMKMPLERVPRLHAEFGNTVTLAPLMALDRLIADRRLAPGAKVILCAAGSGITLTSLAIEWHA
jgi:3-oxoacyl-[acyl-carrier-protein] synthase III